MEGKIGTQHSSEELSASQIKECMDLSDLKTTTEKKI